MTYHEIHSFGGGRLYSFLCTACEKDTPHKNYICLYCKTPQSATRRDLNMKRLALDYYRYGRDGHNSRVAAYLKAISREKKRCLHEAAEQSRQMFEGKKT